MHSQAMALRCFPRHRPAGVMQNWVMQIWRVLQHLAEGQSDQILSHICDWIAAFQVAGQKDDTRHKMMHLLSASSTSLGARLSSSSTIQ